MPTFSPGDRVQADITGTIDIVVSGCVTPATVMGPGAVPGTYNVQTDSPINGVNLFQLTPDRLTPRP